ncbi:MAG: DNA recombination protein RmuC [Candidatus Shapirobacteria bacterium]|nr:DNA recombination protein RmuC [Candidatus Shapirobacteria bacterium]
MISEFFLLLVFFVIALFVAVLLILRKLAEIKKIATPDETLKDWVKSSDQRSQLMSQEISQRLDNAARVIGQVQRNIGEMSEIGRGMKDLQDFLRSPKLRGNIGEQVLKELLTQMLPKSSFSLQYSFKSGVKVDAAIQTSGGIIPVDSKFPMENFRRMMESSSEEEKKAAGKEFIRDVKKHIDDIANKYILTEEGTIDYALMYLPSENVYYEVVNNTELFEYGGKKRVLPVSPTTFYAYLKAILMSFEGQKIEQRAQQILASMKAMQKDYEKVEENLSVLGRHLQNAYNQMGNVSSGFGQLGQKITSTQRLGLDVEKENKEFKKIKIEE